MFKVRVRGLGMHCVVTKISVCVCVLELGGWGIGAIRRYMSKVLLMEKASWSVQKEHIITHTLWGACVCMCVCAHVRVCCSCRMMGPCDWLHWSMNKQLTWCCVFLCLHCGHLHVSLHEKERIWKYLAKVNFAQTCCYPDWFGCLLPARLEVLADEVYLGCIKKTKKNK